MSRRIAIIGAGASGCFASILIRRAHPEDDVVVFEAGRNALAKVAVTGGGRCNLTNSFEAVSSLKEVYPRGEQLMKRCLRRLDQRALMRWFEKEGVRLTVQSDHCVFPVSQDAMQIVRTLLNLMRREGVELRTESRVSAIRELEGGFSLELAAGGCFRCDRVLLSAGGCSKKSLEALLPGDIAIEDTVPSLFTLNIGDESLRSLMGTVVDDVELSLAGTGFSSRGTLLLTDWGVSGPATLKLSSYAARHLAQCGYKASLNVNWTGAGQEQARQLVEELRSLNSKKLVCGTHPDFLTDRLFRHICKRAGIAPQRRWAELGSKGMNRLCQTLCCDTYPVTGRSRFKEEFVTCGGVSLSEINLNTLESRKHPGLFFSGEVLDLDAITGGFNLQAAWSTGFSAAENI